MRVLENECEVAGVDPRKIASIARRISRAALEARSLGVCVFGGSHAGSLRWLGRGNGPITEGPLVLAHLDGSFDGGDGAEHEDSLGLQRGEDGA